MTRLLPACWEWPLWSCDSLADLENWQAGQCAVCASSTGLVHDHCHLTGLTRGWLCGHCNAREGTATEPLFVRYRLAPPALLHGIAHMWGGRGNRHAERKVTIDLEAIHTDPTDLQVLAEAANMPLLLEAYAVDIQQNSPTAHARDSGPQRYVVDVSTDFDHLRRHCRDNNLPPTDLVMAALEMFGDTLRDLAPEELIYDPHSLVTRRWALHLREHEITQLDQLVSDLDPVMWSASRKTVVALLLAHALTYVTTA